MLILWYIFIVSLSLNNFFQFTSAKDSDLEFYLQELESLSELPLDKLIKIKSTFADERGKYIK